MFWKYLVKSTNEVRSHVQISHTSQSRCETQARVTKRTQRLYMLIMLSTYMADYIGCSMIFELQFYTHQMYFYIFVFKCKIVRS